MLCDVSLLALYVEVVVMPDMVIYPDLSNSDPHKDGFTVRNENGKSPRHPKCKICGPWLTHWTNHAEMPAPFCAVEGCLNSAEVGGHVLVIKDGKPLSNHVYIAPICKTHNAQSEDMDLTYTPLVYADQKTCEQQSE